MIGPTDFQIILGKVRPLSRPHPEAHPQVLIIAHGVMRYFTDGHRVIRVRTDTRTSDPEFYTAPAEAWQHRSQRWAARPNLASQIAFTGDWWPCTEAEVQGYCAL